MKCVIFSSVEQRISKIYSYLSRGIQSNNASRIIITVVIQIGIPIYVIYIFSKTKTNCSYYSVLVNVFIHYVL